MNMEFDKKKKNFKIIFSKFYSNKKLRKKQLNTSIFLVSKSFLKLYYLWFRFLNLYEFFFKKNFFIFFHMNFEFKKILNIGFYFQFRFRERENFELIKTLSRLNHQINLKIKFMISEKLSKMTFTLKNQNENPKKIFLKKNPRIYNYLKKNLDKQNKNSSLKFFFKKLKKENLIKHSNLKKENFSKIQNDEYTKFPLEILFKNSLSEFIQVKGTFDFKTKRIKNFSWIWNEANWISRSLKLDKSIKYLEIFYEIFLILLLLFTNSCDFCTLCFSRTKFLKNILLLGKDGGFFWKIFYLDERWRQIKREKISKKKTNEHLIYNTDHAFENNVVLEKCNSNINLLHNGINGQPLIAFFYLSLTKANIYFEDFIFSQISIFFSQTINITSKKKCPKFFENLKERISYFQNRKKKNFYRCYLWPIKFIEVSLSYFTRKFFSNYFLFEKKISSKSDLRWIFYFLFNKISQINMKRNDQFRIEKKEKKIFLSFLVWFINRNCCEQNLKKKLKIFPQFSFSFSKKKYFLEIEKIGKKLFFFFFLKKKTSISFSFYVFLSVFLVKKYQEIVSFEIRQTFYEKFTSFVMESFSFNSINPFISKEISQKKKKYFFCIIKIIYKKTQNQKLNNLIAFSIKASSTKNEEIYIEIKFKPKNFFRTILFFCAKYRINKIFFQTATSFQTGLLFVIKNHISKKNGLKCEKNLFKIQIDQNYYFLKNIQIFNFQPTSIVNKLEKMFKLKSDFPKKKKVLSKESSDLYKIRSISFFSFLFGLKVIFYPNFLPGTFFLSQKEIYESFFFFCQKKFLSEIYFQYDNKKREKKIKSILKFICGLGGRKTRILREKFPKVRLFYENIYFKKKKKEKNYLIKNNCFYKYFRKKNFFSKDHLKNDKLKPDFFFLFSIFSKHQVSVENYQYSLGEKLKEITRFINTKKENFQTKINISDLFQIKKLINFIEKKKNNLGFFENFYFFSYMNFSKITTDKSLDFSPMIVLNLLKITYCENKKNFTRSWKSIITKKYPVGNFLTIKNPKKKGKQFYLGFFKIGVRFFVEKTDLFSKQFEFENILNKTFLNLPSKIIAIYPKIWKARIKITPEKKIFFPLYKIEKKKKNGKAELKKKLIYSKFSPKVSKYKIEEKADMIRMCKWIKKKKIGEWFLWNIKKFYFLISFIVNPEKFSFFSFPIWVKIDQKTKKWIFIFRKNYIYKINDLFDNFIVPFDHFFSKAIVHENFSEKPPNELEKELFEKENLKKKYFFIFCLSEKKLGLFFLIFGFNGKYFKDHFHVDHEGFKWKKKKFSSLYSLRKYIFQNLIN
ncbi:hypothetical protein CMESO_114 (nucleomorph) [Chroomonas mesostigmatica CCMP1168]|uniref:Uncharacterized protein n=1 Tax=Chroomonas mesostigmatica CCMP1168 TaxID=1195612 RepID=J7G5F7_9CRYP|nr:hypothetical protein CMESO_114 [Chroomonas mesostigmatica CCMP1168]